MCCFCDQFVRLIFVEFKCVTASLCVQKLPLPVCHVAFLTRWTAGSSIFFIRKKNTDVKMSVFSFLTLYHAHKSSIAFCSICRSHHNRASLICLYAFVEFSPLMAHQNNCTRSNITRNLYIIIC